MQKFVQIVLAGITDGSSYALIALGFSIVYRVTQSVNLAQGAFCILGALIGMSFAALFGGPAIVAQALAVIAATLVGVALGGAIFVPALRRLPASGVLMVSAGMLTLLNGAILLLWGNQPFVLPQFSGEAPLWIAGVTVSTQSLWIMGTSAAAITAIGWLLFRTGFGRALRACAENREAALLVGIDVPRMALLAFGLAAALGALAGVVVAPSLSFQFNTGSTLTIAGFIAVTIGGMESFWGAIAGGLLLGLAKQFAAGYLPTLAAEALPLCLLLAVLVWSPGGLLAPRARRRSDVREGNSILRPLVRLRGREGVWIPAAFLLLVGGGSYPVLGTGLAPALVIAMILGISLIGLDLLTGFCGQISLGHAGFMAIGGYAAAFLTAGPGWGSLPAIGAGMVIAVACALLLAAVTAQLRGIYLALGTMSFGLLVDAVATNAVEITGGPAGFVGIPVLSVLGFDVVTSRSMFYVCLAVFCAATVVLQGGLRSDFGRTLQSIRTDPMAAAALGIDVERYRTLAFAISAALAALAGSLYAFSFQFLSPDMIDTSHSFELVAMLVLGGEGTLVGGLVGALILTLLPTVFQPLAEYKTLATGLLLIFAFRYFPGGILGLLHTAWRRVGAVRGAAPLQAVATGLPP